MSPALAGGFLSTIPLGKSLVKVFHKTFLLYIPDSNAKCVSYYELCQSTLKVTDLKN